MFANQIKYVYCRCQDELSKPLDISTIQPDDEFSISKAMAAHRIRQNEYQPEKCTWFLLPENSVDDEAIARACVRCIDKIKTTARSVEDDECHWWEYPRGIQIKYNIKSYALNPISHRTLMAANEGRLGIRI